MVFESIMHPDEVRVKPLKSLMLGFIYSTIGMIISIWVFPSDPSLSLVFLTTMAAVPLLVNVLKLEAEEDYAVKKSPLIGNHQDVLGIILFLFIGFLLSFTTWYTVMPQELTNNIFFSQIQTIQTINGVNIQGSFTSTELLKIILLNNFKVLAFCLLFSLLYGAGAVFIITWNSSVLGVAIGNAIKSNVTTAVSIFSAIPMSFGQYLLHGIPEVIAYLLGGIAGGIISAAVIRYDYKSKKFKEVLLDSIDLIILASVIIIISGLIEVYVSIMV